MNDNRSSEQDTARLEWLVIGTGKKLAAHISGSDQRGWAVMDCSDGLTFLSRNRPTWRDAIDEAMRRRP